MTTENKTITNGFLISSLMSSVVLVFWRLFTNSTIPEFEPNEMSNIGLLKCFVWG
mgnify:CR=1 FL=1